MAHEMEIVDAPDTLPLTFGYDSGRGRTLIKTTRDGHIDVRITSDRRSAPSTAGYGNPVRITAKNDSGEDMTLFSDRLGGYDRLKYWYWDLPNEGGERSKTFRIGFERDEIVGQYEDGVYERMPEPGELELVFRVVEYSTSTTTQFGVPSNARVKENTEIRNARLAVEGTTITPEADFAVLASHGVDLPVTVRAFVGGERLLQESVVVEGLTGSTRGGPEITPATFPSFELDDIPYQDNRVRYEIEPREWAEGWVDPVEIEADVANISVNDVAITGCRATPEQVVAGDQVTVRSSVSNPLPVAVGVKGQIDFAGSQATFSRQIGAGEVAPVTKTFRTTEPGTAQPEIRLTSVGGNV